MKLTDLLLGVALHATTAAAQDAPAATPPNVILVAMDTTRADHLGAYGYARDTSPNLDSFAREAVLFERCFSQSNETLTSFASAFTSRLPSDLAPLSYELFRVPDDVHTLPGVLQLHDYQTGGFVAGGHMVSAFGHDRGFDVYQDRWHFGSFFHTVPPALAWVDQRERERPFFLFVHGYDAHSPYAKPLYFEHLFDPDYEGLADKILEAPTPIAIEKVWHGRFYRQVTREQVSHAVGESQLNVLHTDLFSLLALLDPRTGVPLSPRDLEHVVAHYDGSIAYADVQLGLLMTELDERGLLESSVVIVMGDHGEDLFEHGHANHRISLHDASGHVPLLVRFPGGEHGGQRISTPVELLDIMPTVLELVGAMTPAGIRGHSLLPLVIDGKDPTRGSASISEGILPMASARSDTHRLILAGSLPGSPTFMQALSDAHLDDPAFSLFRVGPGVEQRLDLSDPASQEQAVALIDAMRQAYADRPRSGDIEPPYLDPTLIQLMRDKGYW